MLKTEEKEIGGIRFTTTQLPATRGFTLFTRLVKVAGPVVSALGSMNPEEDMVRAIGPLADGLKNLNPDEVVDLALSVLVGTQAIMTDESGKTRRYDLSSRENIDRVFNGKLKSMFEVLAFAIRVNFQDFFGDSSLIPVPADEMTAGVTE